MSWNISQKRPSGPVSPALQAVRRRKAAAERMRRARASRVPRPGRAPAGLARAGANRVGVRATKEAAPSATWPAWWRRRSRSPTSPGGRRLRDQLGGAEAGLDAHHRGDAGGGGADLLELAGAGDHADDGGIFILAGAQESPRGQAGAAARAPRSEIAQAAGGPAAAGAEGRRPAPAAGAHPADRDRARGGDLDQPPAADRRTEQLGAPPGRLAAAEGGQAGPARRGPDLRAGAHLGVAGRQEALDRKSTRP